LEAQRKRGGHEEEDEADLASTLVHVQRLREENRRRFTCSKCWRSGG
jgi:hypothetical protein